MPDSGLFETADNHLFGPADVVRAVRIQFAKSGMTMTSLAEAAQIPRSSVEQILKGDLFTLPSHAEYLAIGQAFGFPTGRGSEWHRAWHDADPRRRRRSQQVIVTGDNANVKVVGETSEKPDREVKLPVQRQEFYFRFLGNAMMQANIAFLLAMLFTAAGAIVTIWGAVMLLAHVGDPTADYTPVFATLSGLVVAGGGGAFAVHAYKSRTHLATRADQVREDIQCDVAFERATILIDRVADSALKDHLLSLTAVKELGLSPTPIDLSKHLPARHITSQRTQEIASGEQP